MASITIKDMSVSYNRGKSFVLDKLNLDIKDGEFCVFLGPSGCGKSTAMHCIAGLLHPVSGEIRFGNEVMTLASGKGKDRAFVPPQERNIAMVFQEYALYPNMTVRENMSFALKTKKAPKDEIEKRVAYMAKLLSIEQLLDRRPAELSGGQRQREVLLLRHLQTECACVQRQLAARLFHIAGEDVDLRRAEEARHEFVGRMIVQITGRSLLHDMSVLHQHDVIRHGHSLGLVMGYVDKCCTDSLVDLGKLGSHGRTELCVKV